MQKHIEVVLDVKRQQHCKASPRGKSPEGDNIDFYH